LYRIEAELKLLVLRLFVSLIYRPITNPANIRSGIKDPNKWCSGNSSCSD
jgi:hypothetical protein